MFGVFRLYMLKRDLWREFRWEKGAMCHALFGYQSASSGAMHGTTTLYHLSSDALTKVASKGHPGKVWSSSQSEADSFPSKHSPHTLSLPLEGPLYWAICLWATLFMVSTPVFWPREFHGLYSPWGLKESDTTEWFSLSLWASFVAQLVKNPPALQETWVWSLSWEDPLENG